MANSTSEELLLGEYLLRRLYELGITTIFGVPGDFELPLLDQIPPSQWSGSPNELIAAYSADGYARIKRYGALITTFGPGETSALCGTAGSFCESVPVLHIVGYPGVRAQTKGKILHHTLGDLRYDHYLKMSAEITCAATVIKSAEEAPHEIDRIINAMIYHNRPAYLGFPVDLQTTKITTDQLSVPLIQSLTVEEKDIPTIKETTSKVFDRLKESARPIIISDGGVARNQVQKEVEALATALHCPIFTTLMGKGSINEQNQLFCGVYGGKGSLPDAIKIAEGSDCVLWVGNFPSDFNTGGFSENVAPENVIDFQRFEVKIGTETYLGNIKAVLAELIEQIETQKLVSKYENGMPCTPYPAYKESEVDEIKHKWLWQRFSSFLKPFDILVTETGCSQAGMVEAYLPSGIKLFTQAIFGSIGYAPGAAVGASFAGKELNDISENKEGHKRLVLVEGDGSLQLTAQAFSVLLRGGLIPVIFVINNGGYTVERVIHGLHAPYNKIPPWDYTGLLKVFAPDIKSKSYRVSTAKELDSLMKDKEFNEAPYAQLVEIIMDEYDFPGSIEIIGETAAKHNSG